MSLFSRRAQNEIAHFRGFPPEESQAILRQPVPLDNLMSVVFEEHRINQPGFQQTLMANWKQIVGPGNSHRCSPLQVLENGILIVAAPNPTFRQELNFQKSYFLKEIRKLPGGNHIRGLRFISG